MQQFLTATTRFAALMVVLMHGALSDAAAQMTARQAVELRQPTNLTWSPDGTQLAYVVVQASLANDRIESTLFVTTAAGGKPRALVTVDLLGEVHWSADGRSLIYVAKLSNGHSLARTMGSDYQAFSLDVRTGKRRQLTSHRGGIGPGLRADAADSTVFQLSPNGRKAIFISRDIDQARKQLTERWDADFLYTDEDTLNRSVLYSESAWQTMPAAGLVLWIVDLETGHERALWRCPAKPVQTSPSAPWFGWSPDGRKIALIWADFRDPAAPRTPLVIISADSLEVHDALPLLTGAHSASWDPGGASLSFVSRGETVHEESGSFTYSLTHGTLARLPGDARPARAGKRALNTMIATATRDPVRQCTANSRGAVASCIREDSVTPPEVVFYPLDDAGVSGIGRAITHLNPELEGHHYGEVRTITGKADDRVASGIVLPVNYQPGQRYPLVVMLYNQFNGPHTFTGVGNFPNYPPQVFASQGYVVLLFNLPVDSNRLSESSFSARRRRHVESVVESLCLMVDQLIANQIADPSRIGIMGWSWGGFYTPYIQTHHPQWFQAAAMGEGGNHQPSSYWLEGAVWRGQEDRFFGEGGPNGPNAAAWRSVAPIHHVAKMRAPLLMEYSGASSAGIDLNQAIRDAGRLSELHIYRNEAHVFVRPKNLLTSTERHVDWFNFWLRGVTDSVPVKVEQYKRWRAMRVKQCELFGKEPDAPWYCRR